jgi:hypothetical protein
MSLRPSPSSSGKRAFAWLAVLAATTACGGQTAESGSRPDASPDRPDGTNASPDATDHPARPDAAPDVRVIRAPQDSASVPEASADVRVDTGFADDAASDASSLDDATGCATDACGLPADCTSVGCPSGQVCVYAGGAGGSVPPSCTPIPPARKPRRARVSGRRSAGCSRNRYAGSRGTRPRSAALRGRRSRAVSKTTLPRRFGGRRRGRRGRCRGRGGCDPDPRKGAARPR